MQKDLREQRMGPAKKVAVDAAGNPTPAALGFAKNAGVPFEKLTLVSTTKRRISFSGNFSQGPKNSTSSS